MSCSCLDLLQIFQMNFLVRVFLIAAVSYALSSFLGGTCHRFLDSYWLCYCTGTYKYVYTTIVDPVHFTCNDRNLGAFSYL
jgi:hypothetical protein